LALRARQAYSRFPGDAALCQLVGVEPFTALLICSQFQNPVNPLILFFDRLIKVIYLLQNPRRGIQQTGSHRRNLGISGRPMAGFHPLAEDRENV
jgi:hypothetical protein